MGHVAFLGLGNENLNGNDIFIFESERFLVVFSNQILQKTLTYKSDEIGMASLEGGSRLSLTTCVAVASTRVFLKPHISLNFPVVHV